jgi:hypothetical protein
MQFPRRDFVLLSLTAALSILMVSCSESKVSQCNKIIKVANKAADEAKAITKGGKESDSKAMLKAADALDKASQEMESIKVSDAKLRDYQGRFFVMYRDTSKATRDFITAFEKKDRSAAEAAVIKLQKTTALETPLVQEINKYCQPEK